jgi:hypothetical protein
VHGRLDFKAGGFINKEYSMTRLEYLQLPDFLFKIAERIIDGLAGQHLKEKILELKAVSTFAMDMVERRQAAIPQHTLQGYHYQKNGKLPAGVCYICKDDCRMAEFWINKKETEPLYKEDIEQMSDYFKKGKRPPLAPLATFDFSQAKFSKNQGVEYSPYLTMLYGFQDPDEYRQSIKFVDSWNRALSRFALAETGGKTPTGKLITPTTKNLEVKAAIIKAGYDFKKILAAKIEMGTTEEDEE